MFVMRLGLGLGSGCLRTPYTSIYTVISTNSLQRRYKLEANYDKGESVIQVEVDGATMFLNWYNSCIFTHLKKYDQVDHIFIGSEEGDESVTQGTFIFRQVLENFDEVVDYLDDYNFPHIHKPYPSETDTETYLKAAETDLDKADEIAAYWEKEGS